MRGRIMRQLIPVEWPEMCDMCGRKYDLSALYEKYGLLLGPACLQLMERRKNQ